MSQSDGTLTHIADAQHVAGFGGLASQGTVSFLPFVPPNSIILFNMSAAHVFSGAHHLELRDCTINAASTVCENAIRYSLCKLMVWIFTEQRQYR